VALAAQDGLKPDMIPWDELDAIFVGATTEWKMSDMAAEIMYQAKEYGKWVHVGRVNSWTRLEQLKVNPDSIDGTHWAKRPDLYMRRWHNELLARQKNYRLPFLEEVEQWPM